MSNSAYSGQYFAALTGKSSVVTSNKLITQVFALNQSNEYELTFAHIQKKLYGNFGILKIYYKNSSTAEWQLLKEFNTEVPAWQMQTVPLENPSDYYVIALEGNISGVATIGIDALKIDFKNDITENIFEVNMFPNPTTGILNIAGENINLVTIYEISGKLVFETTLNSDLSKIDISNIARGIYFIKIKQNENYIIKKLVIE